MFIELVVQVVPETPVPLPHSSTEETKTLLSSSSTSSRRPSKIHQHGSSKSRWRRTLIQDILLLLVEVEHPVVELAVAASAADEVEVEAAEPRKALLPALASMPLEVAVLPAPMVASTCSPRSEAEAEERIRVGIPGAGGDW